MFRGFSMELSEFYWELLFHNERPWFQAHKEDYIRLLKEPFQALAEDTLAALQRRFPKKELRLHVSRIYRDARRLFGRGPYKEHVWFSIKDVHSTPMGPDFWFEVGASSYSYGVGAFGRAAEMENWRRCIDANPARVERLARRIARQDVFHLGGEDYARLKGDRGALLNPWYNKKWLELSCRHDFGGELLSSGLPELLAEAYAWLMPYYELFMEIYQNRTGDEL